jgi:hypothetical protein
VFVDLRLIVIAHLSSSVNLGNSGGWDQLNKYNEALQIKDSKDLSPVSFQFTAYLNV